MCPPEDGVPTSEMETLFPAIDTGITVKYHVTMLTNITQPSPSTSPLLYEKYLLEKTANTERRNRKVKCRR